MCSFVWISTSNQRGNPYWNFIHWPQQCSGFQCRLPLPIQFLKFHRANHLPKQRKLVQSTNLSKYLLISFNLSWKLEKNLLFLLRIRPTKWLWNSSTLKQWRSLPKKNRYWLFYWKHLNVYDFLFLIIWSWSLIYHGYFDATRQCWWWSLLQM